MRIVITGGGTGGHIYPALAVAEALKDEPFIEELLYIGKESGMEQELVQAHGISFAGIAFSGMPRRLTPAFFRWLISLGGAIHKAGQLLDEVRPDVVFGTGGYVSAPVLMAAKLRRIPFVVHEPDAHPGLVNRLMGRWASGVTAAFAEANRLIGSRNFYVTGNPIRGELGQLSKAEALQRLRLDWPAEERVLVVTGGSQGARTINQAIIGALPYLVEQKGLRVIHQSGKTLYEEAKAEAAREGYDNHPAYLLRPFFEDMAAVMACADLALCRAGSMSLSELYVCGIPSILVPYPFAAADHQRKNALASQQAGASVMIPDADLSVQTLTHTVQELLSQPEHLAQMKAAAHKLAHPDATAQIIKILKAQVEGLLISRSG